MNRLIGWLAGSIIVASLVCALTPSLVRLVNALVPFTLVAGILVITARLVWHYTNRF